MRRNLPWPWFAYNVAQAALLPALAGWLAGRAVRGKSLRGLSQRLGLAPAAVRRRGAPGPVIWMHAVSVGEVRSAAPVAAALREALPEARLLVSTVTPTGQEMAGRICPVADGLFYLPFDVLPAVLLTWAAVRPDVCVLMESELWPNLLWTAGRWHTPVVLVNGRISDVAFRRAQRVRPFYRWALRQIARLCMQSELDASRALELGADPARVTVTGNTKFDSLPSATGSAGRALAGELGLTGADELLVAGSTHPGEEAVALEAYLRVRRKHPEARLLIAPRHIERAAEVARLVSARGLPVALRTRGRPEAGSVIVLDTIGELGEAYGLGAAAFVGKSLVGSGGHNVLEPAALGKPVFFGPRMENFRDIADIVRAAGVGFEVHSAAELAEGWERALGDAGFRAEVAGKAAKMMADSVGAARRSASIVLEALGRGQR